MNNAVDDTTQDSTTTTLSRREFLKLAAAAGMVGLVGEGLLGSSAFAQVPKKGGHLKLGLGGGATTDSQDPATFISQVSLVNSRIWGDTLVEVDPLKGTAVPSLAESWTNTPDAKTWTFKIRKGVHFHNGKELTVDDCLATLKRHSDEKSASTALSVMKMMGSIGKQGDTLVITLPSGNAELPLLLSDWRLVMQPNGGYDNPASGVGTGPYKLTSWAAGVRSTYEKNTNDWRSDRGHVQSVELLVMNDATARIAALTSGQVHFINLINPKTIDLLKRSPNVQILSTPGRAHYTFPMHCDTAPFNNNDLRMALKYAINREEMVRKVLGGYGKVGNDFPINNTYALFPEGIEQRTYDPDKAKFYYKKSGYSGSIVLHTAEIAFPGAVDAAVLFQESAKKAGISIDVKRDPDDGFWNNVWLKVPFCQCFWTGRPTQDQMYSLVYQSGATWNESRFVRPDFDQLLLEARAELNEEKRKDMYRSMAMMVRDDGGEILPMFNNYLNAATKEVKGYVHDIGLDMSSGYVASRVWLNT
ncbi:extracellular solute-binding protein [Caballeronia udeis]|uniref:Extracellular solute-binding protein n=1 Tax=Caballeronia udeis TaxID=1232866 RepID=A0A158GZX0_9BURK|nr:ABC transporter substrate-binding protein [Caballeronia udeis]SAL37443.1 extracellular solute-binding protein [Caballeronia udeis]